MKKIYFKCTLCTDIVLNASLATEGNMETLDYIPGSNFLGIVAGNGRYKNFQKDVNKKGWAYDIFHSGKVSFGDAHLALDKKEDEESAQSYATPFTLHQNKLEQDILKYPIHVNPMATFPASKIQWEQVRGGYFNPKNKYVKKVERKFSLKSAQSRAKRQSEEGKMYGFESLRKGQAFVFSVDFKDENQPYVQEVIDALTKGKKRIGKSRSAQYGQVEIKEIDQPQTFPNGAAKENQLTIYAESNLCLFNDFGQLTFQPTAKHFGIIGKVDWELSKIRTYSYSPWNAHRNTTNTQRDCILKGSVIVFKLEQKESIEDLPQKVGGYTEEGLGRVIYNPSFLDFGKDGLWSTNLTAHKVEEETPIPKNDEQSAVVIPKPSTPLALFLSRKNEIAEQELAVAQAVQNFMNKYQKLYEDSTSSQWGGIRSKAIQATDFDKLMDALFSEQSGYLVKGIAAESYWNKNDGKRRRILKAGIQEEPLKKLGTKNQIQFITKLATEMAKEVQRKKLSNEVHA